MHEGWIGVDLDGVLARYDGWRGPTHIGEPIAPMVKRVQGWLRQGKDVRIFTARINPAMRESPEEANAQIQLITGWCLTYLGQVLPLTYEKDYLMIELWDDRCVQVVPNTGQRADGKQE